MNRPTSNELAEPNWSIASAWNTQRRDWQLGLRRPADDYLPPDDDSLLDLIYGELLIRRELGESPELSDYLPRFPKIESGLRRLFSWEVALSQLSAEQEPDAARDDTHASGERPTVLWPAKGSTPPPVSTEPARAPESLGRYRIIAPLGGGGQATVYRAVHPTLHRDVVLKWCREAGELSDEQERRLVEEGRLLATLAHPGIGRIYDLEFQEGRPFLVMEFVSGGDLEHFAQTERPTPREAAQLVAHLARSLAYAHEKGALHLDIKPRNVVVGGDGQGVLIDFGMARLRSVWVDEPSRSTYFQGTLAYMAPEQAADDPTSVTAATDVFGLGGVLYYLLTLRPLRSGGSFSELVEAVKMGDWNEEALRESSADESLREICRRALIADPAKRTPSASRLADELEAYLSSTSDSPFSRRNSILIGLGVAAAVLVGIGFATSPWWRAANQPAQPEAPLEFVAPLEAKVWRTVRQQARFVDLRNAVPLRNGDEVKFSTIVPPGAFAAILSFNPREGWQLLSQVDSQPQSQTLRFPRAENTAAPLQGSPGVEVFLALISRSPISPNDIPPLPSGTFWTKLRGPLLIRVTPDRVAIEQKPRDFGPAVVREDPLEALQTAMEALRGALKGKVDQFTGFAVVHE